MSSPNILVYYNIFFLQKRRIAKTIGESVFAVWSAGVGRPRYNDRVRFRAVFRNVNGGKQLHAIPHPYHSFDLRVGFFE